MENAELNLLKQIMQDLTFLKKDISFIKHVIGEEFELSEFAKEELELACATPRNKYISQEDVEKEFLCN